MNNSMLSSVFSCLMAGSGLLAAFVATVAAIHAILDDLLKIAPGVLAIEPHFFPLDRRCNPGVTLQDPDAAGEVRCAATRALLCLEDDPRKFHLAQKLIYENARGLTTDKLWEILSPIATLESLAPGLSDPRTQEKLESDIASAQAHHLQGTPLVFLNGKEVRPFGPLLYVLTLTGGATKSAALTGLPAPQIRAKPLPLPASPPTSREAPPTNDAAAPTRKRLTVPRPARPVE